MSNPIPSLPGEAVAPRHLSAGERLDKLPKPQPRFTVLLALPSWVGGTVDRKPLVEAIAADSPELAVELFREEVAARMPFLSPYELTVLAVFAGDHRSLI